MAGGPDAPHLARARTAEAVTEHCRAAIVAAGPACVAVKPQLACFERLGAPGWEALEQVVAIARDHGLLVLADGKRGDVPVTAAAYAQALVGATPTPFGDVAGPRRRRLHREPAARPRRARAARRRRRRRRRRLLRARAHLEPRRGRAPGLRRAAAARAARGAGRRAGPGPPRRAAASRCVGAVTGATRPEHLGRLRELMPHAIFLLPGVGAQGGRVEDLGRGVRAAPGRRPRDRLALDRERARRARRRPGRSGGRGRRGAAGRGLGALAQPRPQARFGPILNGPR